MSAKRVRFEYRNAPSYDYIIKFRDRRHYIYDRHYEIFGKRDELIGDTSTYDDALSFLKATARSGYTKMRIDDV
jgi:Tfp pilus assembly ATPase PilU